MTAVPEADKWQVTRRVSLLAKQPSAGKPHEIPLRLSETVFALIALGMRIWCFLLSLVWGIWGQLSTFTCSPFVAGVAAPRRAPIQGE